MQQVRKYNLGGAESAPEALLLNRIALIGLPEPQTQVQLIPGRKFRFDCVFGEPWKVAIDLLMKMQKRAEQQALSLHGLNFVIDDYLPKKLKNPAGFLP